MDMSTSAPGLSFFGKTHPMKLKAKVRTAMMTIATSIGILGRLLSMATARNACPPTMELTVDQPDCQEASVLARRLFMKRKMKRRTNAGECVEHDGDHDSVVTKGESCQGKLAHACLRSEGGKEGDDGVSEKVHEDDGEEGVLDAHVPDGSAEGSECEC